MVCCLGRQGCPHCLCTQKEPFECGADGRVHQEVNRKVASWAPLTHQSFKRSRPLEVSPLSRVRAPFPRRESQSLLRAAFFSMKRWDSPLRTESIQEKPFHVEIFKSTQSVTDKFDSFFVLSFRSRVERFINSEITETRMGIQTASSQIEAWPLSSLVLFCFPRAGAACLEGGSRSLGLDEEGGNPLQTQPVSKKSSNRSRNSIKNKKGDNVQASRNLSRSVLDWLEEFTENLQEKKKCQHGKTHPQTLPRIQIRNVPRK